MGVCAACKNGYELNSLSNTCLLCFVSNCINCISDNVCSACQPGYILSADKKTCIFSSCSFPCSTCNNITQQCTSCISPPFNANPDPNGQCYTCDVLNCLTCAFNNTTVCLACSASFTLVNGICQSSCYLTGCLSCSSGNPTIC